MADSATGPDADYPEIVFGLVAPLGIQLERVTRILEGELRRVGYSSEVLRLSELIFSVKGLKTRRSSEPEHRRISTHMKGGTELRNRCGGGILARLAVAAIRRARSSQTNDPNEPQPKHAYVLRSIKHVEEIKVLRETYSDRLVVLALYSQKDARTKAVINLIRMPGVGGPALRKIADGLIDTDESEAGEELGQTVSEAFPHADFFVDASSKDSLGEDLRRTIEIYFGNHFQTPTRDEFGMYQAAAAARRSADLSRQVGAALTSAAGDLMALGCNDTPKFGGGLYWTGDEPDGRDFALFGHDPAEQTRRDIVTEVLVRLKGEKYLSAKGMTPKASALADKLISGPLKGATITKLLEFGRVLHAEMAAITDAAKRGVATAGSTLFCTTFPCHLCTRIIVAAGVVRVVFIEPYPKSKSQDLYPDSISVDELNRDEKKVSFEPFVGVAPRRYDSLFEPAWPRKENGLAIEWDSKKARPRLRSRIQSAYLQAESVCTADIDDILGAKGLRLRG